MIPNRVVVIATKNKGKMVEFGSALEGLGLQFLSLHDFSDMPTIVEDGRTFEENARKKALVTVKHTGFTALADDSGLEVDYLGGAPGVRSARFAGVDGDDHANNEKLLDLLAGVPLGERKARFCCALALVTPEGEIVDAFGTVEGYIGTAYRGEGGFGYDPLFIVPEYEKTFGELDLVLKNQISHRGLALTQLRGKLVEISRGK